MRAALTWHDTGLYAAGVTLHSPGSPPRGAPWDTGNNTYRYPEGVSQMAAITMTPPSRLVKRLRRIVAMGTGNPGCAAERGDPGLWNATASR